MKTRRCTNWAVMPGLWDVAAEVLEQTAEGKVDILIGTYKLLQSDIKWHEMSIFSP